MLQLHTRRKDATQTIKLFYVFSSPTLGGWEQSVVTCPGGGCPLWRRGRVTTNTCTPPTMSHSSTTLVNFLRSLRAHTGVTKELTNHELGLLTSQMISNKRASSRHKHRIVSPTSRWLQRQLNLRRAQTKQHSLRTQYKTSSSKIRVGWAAITQRWCGRCHPPGGQASFVLAPRTSTPRSVRMAKRFTVTCKLAPNIKWITC
ncbi:hypothetical protein E2C01_079184 [Portunus trituberculatus]|uniref:Uncharacterized protein n=1 Tax=Portunus trituberculatus TaxID=210409 RepID=A0A5B7IS25_PORTR|nr:hypothetical protein [Portunus trituberculatus]